MNFLNTFDLIPKNFLVANMVDILKEDPENGVNKIFNMADNFIKDKDVKEMMGIIQNFYNQNSAVKLYIKNMIYNSSKTCLNHTIQNLAVNEMWDGFKKREKNSVQYGVDIPHAIVISPNMACGLDCFECPSSEHVAPLMSIQAIKKIVNEARELGIHCIIIDGGDPYLNKDLLTLYENNTDIQFLVFTPGACIDSMISQRLSKHGNVINLFVYDGTESEKGEKGTLIQSKVLNAMSLLKQQGLLFGVITPIKQSNIEVALSNQFIIQMIRNGSRFNAYVNSVKETSKEKLNRELLKRVKTEIQQIRVTKPYLTFYLDSLSLFIDRCVTGPYVFEIESNSNTFSFLIPQITSINSQGLSLVQILKNSK